MEHAQDSFLAGVFHEVVSTQLPLRLEPDRFSEVGDKMSFRFGIAIPEAGDIAFIEAGSFQARSRRTRIPPKSVKRITALF
jgi:hypothetical protein